LLGKPVAKRSGDEGYQAFWKFRARSELKHKRKKIEEKIGKTGGRAPPYIVKRGKNIVALESSKVTGEGHQVQKNVIAEIFCPGAIKYRGGGVGRVRKREGI